MRTIPNELERKEIFEAYIMRRHRLSKLPEEADTLGGDIEKVAQPLKRNINDFRLTVNSTDGSGTKYHTFSDIGRYTVFPDQARKRMFPARVFGRVDEDEIVHTGKLALMCREQGLRITNDLARLTLPGERNVDYSQIAHSMSAREIKDDLLFDESAYTAIVQDISLSMHDYISKGERRNELRKFFLPPGVFDGVVNVLAQELTKKPMRPHICD